MSMICSLRLLGPEELAALHAEPESIEDLIAAEGSDAQVELCIDKAWHGIHFLLTGAESGGRVPLDPVVLRAGSRIPARPGGRRRARSCRWYSACPRS